MYGSHRLCGIGNNMVLVCHVILQEHVTKVECLVDLENPENSDMTLVDPENQEICLSLTFM